MRRRPSRRIVRGLFALAAALAMAGGCAGESSCACSRAITLPAGSIQASVFEPVPSRRGDAAHVVAGVRVGVWHVDGRAAVSPLEPPPTRPPAATATADGDGLVRFDGLPPGRYLLASLDDRLRGGRAVRLDDGPGPGLAFAVYPPPTGLPPLRPGPRRLVAATPAGAGLIGRVTLPEMTRAAPRVVVGRVVAIGAAERLGRGLLRHRVRLFVVRALRGPATPYIDVSVLRPVGMYPFEVGRDYLVFAERRPLGPRRAFALVPMGYAQGVYVRVGSDAAANGINGRVGLDALAARLRAG